MSTSTPFFTFISFVDFPLSSATVWLLVGAFAIGCLGSVAYFTALYFKFVGINDKYRKIIIEPFQSNNLFFEKISKRKVLWYCSIGGLIACVFQANVPTFVAIQNFIIGATWPGIVSQFLSGRMESPTRDERLVTTEDLKTKEVEPPNAAEDFDERFNFNTD